MRAHYIEKIPHYQWVITCYHSTKTLKLPSTHSRKPSHDAMHPDPNQLTNTLAREVSILLPTARLHLFFFSLWFSLSTCHWQLCIALSITHARCFRVCTEHDTAYFSM